VYGCGQPKINQEQEGRLVSRKYFREVAWGPKLGVRSVFG